MSEMIFQEEDYLAGKENKENDDRDRAREWRQLLDIGKIVVTLKFKSEITLRRREERR